MVEISNRPYIIRAMFDWIVDNQWTPHLQVDVNYPGIQVPEEYAQEGVVVLNIHPDAVRQLKMANDWFSFKARFHGIEREVSFPPGAVLAIFARENGQGMPFPAEPYSEVLDESSDDNRASSSKKATKKPHLTIVK